MSRDPVLELRVHGVHGTPVHSMLGIGAATDARRIRGDSRAGFYEAREYARTSGPPLPPGATRQAYFWGALTSPVSGAVASLKRAGWLTLLPFALVNLAMWARPRIAPGARGACLSACLLRVAGLLLTALLVTTACGIGIDLVAWQCFREGVPQCSRIPGGIQALVIDHVAAAEQRLALGQLVPLGALMVIAWLARSTAKRYESYEHPLGGGAARTDLLSKPALWQGEKRFGALLATHLSVGLAVLVGYTSYASSDRADRHGGLLQAAGWASVGVAVLATAVTLWGVLSQPEHQANDAPPQDPTWLPAVGVLVLAAALAAGNTFLLWQADIDVVNESQRLRGVGAFPVAMVVALFVVVACLVGVHRQPWTMALPLLALALGAAVYRLVDSGPHRFWWFVGVLGTCALVGIVLHKAFPRPDWAWDGAAPAVLLGAALGTAVLFSSGLTLVIADALNGSPRVSALRTELPESDPPVGALVLGADVRVQDGWLEAGLVPRLHAGLLTTSTLTGADADGAGPQDLRPFTSQVLTDVRLSLPGGALTVSRTCVVTDSGAATRPSGATIPTDLVDVVSGGTVPEGCPPGKVLAGPVRAVATATATPLAVAAPYMWFAATLPILLGLQLLLLLPLLVPKIGRHPFCVKRHLTQFALGDPDRLAPLPDALRRRCFKARGSAALAHRAERLIEIQTLAMVTTGVVTAAGVLSNARPVAVGGWLSGLTTAGLFLNVAAAGGLIFVGSEVRSSFELRRTTAVLWDLTTFFPRVAHPFAPPCYGERVVPELTSHVRCALERGGRVILSAHSQGSTISAAVLMQLDTEELKRVRFITYGTQLRAWFGRIFPALFGPEVLGHQPTQGRPHFGSPEPDLPPTAGAWASPGPASLAGLLDVTASGGRWVSLFRRTDPLGFRVWSDAADASNPVDRVASEWSPVPQPVDALQLPQGHGDYPDTPEYAVAVGAWFDELLPEPDKVVDLDVPPLVAGAAGFVLGAAIMGLGRAHH